MTKCSLTLFSAQDQKSVKAEDYYDNSVKVFLPGRK